MPAEKYGIIGIGINMMTEQELRNWREIERDRLEFTISPEMMKYRRELIGILTAILQDD